MNIEMLVHCSLFNCQLSSGTTANSDVSLHPRVSLRPNRQRADADARCGEDRIADRGYCRRQRGFAQTGRIEVRLKELDFNRRRGVPYTRRLILVEITLYDAALVDRNFPSHHVAHRFDEPSLNEVVAWSGFTIWRPMSIADHTLLTFNFFSGVTATSAT